MEPFDPDIQRRVEHLLTLYVHCIDEDRLEEWPDFFTEDCLYKIVSTENHGQGLPMGVVYADSRGMLRDRISALREANIYEPHRYRHLVSSTLVTSASDGFVEAVSHYMVVRIMHAGPTDLFSVGRYLDRIDMRGTTPLFREKLVVFDNARIDTLLAIPL